MSDKKKQDQQSDYFNQYMRQQLKNHRLSPDECCWDEINQLLRKRRNHLFLRRSFYIAGPVVLALLLLVSIPKEKYPHFPQFENMEEFVSFEVNNEKPIDDPVLAKVDVKPRHGSSAPTVFEETTFEEIIEIVSENEPKEDIKQEEEPENDNSKHIVDEKKKKTELPLLPDKHTSPVNKMSKKRNRQVGAGLITMGSNSLGDRESLLYDNNSSSDGSSSIPSIPNYNNHLNLEDYNDISYNLPLSFGITARKELGRGLSVETGLVYTYLSTTLRKNSPNMAKGNLKLHYVGIPANLIVDLWDNSKWNIYASGGVMVEKGLRSVYTQHTYRASSEEKIIMKTSISGFQWSMNGSLGISYRLLEDWSLYAEPGISYFFDNNQPISVRTDKPLTFGFGFGVRFNF